jgi:hypothetical protein
MHHHRCRTALFLFALAATVTPVAAGQYCAERLEGGSVLRPTEAEARKDAENWWTSRAGSLGKGFQDWSIAKDKSVDCRKNADDTFRCTAAATPCLAEGTLPNDVPKIEM